MTMSVVANGRASVFDQYLDDYEVACHRGLALSGETRDHFARRRVGYTRRRCAALVRVRGVVDFGCGLGHTVPYLTSSFPEARLWGVDTAAGVVQAAVQRYGSDRVQFCCGDPDLGQVRADLVYCNGVFHHIEVTARKEAAQKVLGWLNPGGIFALWENNPWNPGTRIVMRRIPFDRDAVPLSYLEAERLLRAAGFRLLGTTFHFFFPSLLRAFRRIEPLLEQFPLGAQYCVLARRPL